MEQNIDFDREREQLTRKAWGATIAYVVGLLALACLALFGEAGIDAFLDMRPNEVGDLLAGIAGPLAFIWLVYGYFLQGIAIRQQAEELRQNTRVLALQEQTLQAQEQALRSQAEELKQSVLQQIELVQTSRSQLEFEKAKHRDEKEAEKNKIAPIFEYHITDPDDRSNARKKSHLEQNKTLELEFVNRGGDAINVSLDSNVVEVEIQPKSFVVLKQNAIGRFFITIPKGHDFKQTIVELSYSDILRAENTRKFLLLCSRNENGHISYGATETSHEP